MGLEQREVKRADLVVSGGAFARRGHNPSASTLRPDERETDERLIRTLRLGAPRIYGVLKLFGGKIVSCRAAVAVFTA